MVTSKNKSYTSTPKKSSGGTSHFAQQKSPQEQANQATFDREQEIRALFDEIIGTYSPGGSYGAGTEAMLQREKTRYLGQGTQSLISSGLYGSTMAAGLGTKFEEEIGMPTRAKLEDIRLQAYTEALGQKAGFIERIEDQLPSYETIAGLTAQGAAAPQESLADWLYGTFQGSGSPSVQTKSSSNTQSLAETQAGKAKAQADYEAKYANTPNPTYDYSMMYNDINTEEDRDARKKAGYYLGSDGKYHTL